MNAPERWAGLRVEFDGRTYRPFDDDPFWANMRPGSIGQRRVVEEGRYFDAAGDELDGKVRQRVVDRLLGKVDTTPIFDPTAEGEVSRPYLPGLWYHGTVPPFIGPKGWGKTKFLCPLAAAVIIKGRRFLGHFEPVELTDEERQRDVWMINPATRPSAVHDELLAAGLAFGYREGVPCYHDPDDPDWESHGVLIVEHIVRKAGRFNLTDPAKAEWWETRLVEFADRRQPPLTVIVDDITSIVGSDTGQTGRFVSAFRGLLDEAGIPNGLVVMHSPMSAGVDTAMGGVESLAESDGMWLASATRFPVEPSTPRYFRALPRLGDPEVPKRRIVMDADRMLTLVDVAAKDGAIVEGVDTGRETLLNRLAEAEGEWVWTKALCGTGDLYTANKKVLERLEAEGLVEVRHHTEGRVRGYQWRLAD